MWSVLFKTHVNWPTFHVNSSPPWTKWPTTWQATVSKTFSWMKLIKFRFQVPGAQLTINQHWFRKWLGTNRRQAITWTNDDPVHWRIYAALGGGGGGGGDEIMPVEDFKVGFSKETWQWCHVGVVTSRIAGNLIVYSTGFRTSIIEYKKRSSLLAPYDANSPVTDGCTARGANNVERVSMSLRWRHNGCDCVSNHQPRDCLLNLLFGRRSK